MSESEDDSLRLFVRHLSRPRVCSVVLLGAYPQTMQAPTAKIMLAPHCTNHARALLVC
jgi:hypothetical protein